MILEVPKIKITGKKTKILQIIDMRNNHILWEKEEQNFICMKKMSSNFITSLTSEIGFIVKKSEIDEKNGFSIILFSIQTLLILIKAGSIAKDTTCGFYLDK